MSLRSGDCVGGFGVRTIIDERVPLFFSSSRSASTVISPSLGAKSNRPLTLAKTQRSVDARRQSTWIISRFFANGFRRVLIKESVVMMVNIKTAFPIKRNGWKHGISCENEVAPGLQIVFLNGLMLIKARSHTPTTTNKSRTQAFELSYCIFKKTENDEKVKMIRFIA